MIKCNFHINNEFVVDKWCHAFSNAIFKLFAQSFDEFSKNQFEMKEFSMKKQISLQLLRHVVANYEIRIDLKFYDYEQSYRIIIMKKVWSLLEVVAVVNLNFHLMTALKIEKNATL